MVIDYPSLDDKLIRPFVAHLVDSGLIPIIASTFYCIGDALWTQ